MQSENEKIIHNLKHPVNGDTVRIPISHPNKGMLGYFVPITEAVLNDTYILSEMTRWRTENMNCFLTQFTPTVERTKSWIQNVILPDDSRILFLIYCNGELKGQLGFCDITDESATGDNFILKESGLNAGEIVLISKVLYAWAFTTLSLKYCIADVLKSNKGGILINRLLGFKMINETPLKLVTAEDKTLYVEDDSLTNPADINVHLVLTHEAFDMRYK